MRKEVAIVLGNLIYVFEDGHYDRARWLDLHVGIDGALVFNLQDLCHPGRLSSLRQISCPIDIAGLALEQGTLQVTASNGYLLIRRCGDQVSLEFKSLDDIAGHKVYLRCEDVSRRIDVLKSKVVKSYA